ncbi:hypothetical protein SAMN05216344_11015 [Polaromonas sp. OV174]|uniref:hypothetical protein n=1 Tax=Polaromonas sp. OV174 TaxID=1855300 RepID=UPI0008E9D0EC|nr:hypothetical protein [Polaromonas sp. OV174]SFC14943.1 hypothetical protein SAMN05216344_11015 [Polaromonas sp. OV174]
MKIFRFFFAGLLLAAGLQGAMLPAYANGNKCLFKSSGLNMSFGELNPASGENVLRQMSGSSTVGDCAPGQTMTISGDIGQNGNRNLKNAAGDLIPYSLSLPLTMSGPGNDNYVAFTFNGSILWSDYANAPEGRYFDQVMISVTP